MRFTRSLILLFLLIFGRQTGAMAQDNTASLETAITFEAILGQLISTNEDALVFKNLTIKISRYSAEAIARLYPEVKVDSGKLILNKSLEFRNCRITGRGLLGLQMENIVFKNCRFRVMTIANVTAKSLIVKGGDMVGVKVMNSRFDNISFTNLDNNVPETGLLSIYKTNVRQKILLRNNAYFENIAVFKSTAAEIQLKKNKAGTVGIENTRVNNQIEISDVFVREYIIRKNIFNSRDTLKYTFDLHCDKLVYIDNTINATVLFADSRVVTRLEMADNTFNYPVDFHDMSFPEFDKYIPFSQFKQGFVVYDNLYGDETPDGETCYYCKLYRGESDEELADKTNFDKLVQSYEILFLGYKSTGDIESANLSYIKIKDLYLSRLGYLYRTNGGFKLYFRWKLAQLLKFYTNHGTDPALSIVISIYVILVFAVFYIFFPSDWDVTSKKRLIADFRNFIDSKDKGYAKPLLTLLVGFGISLINAITLSLNSFVTLGFGTIPTTGAARYVCILQGFIGWFLLSIFTVSLINQILF